MKTPLQILGGYAENLKDVEGSDEKDRYADQILEKTTEMNKDIEAILKELRAFREKRANGGPHHGSDIWRLRCIRGWKAGRVQTGEM